MIRSFARTNGSFRLTASNPSDAMVATLRECLTSFMFVALREGRVPWRGSAHVPLKSGHSGCMANHAILVVNGNFVKPFMMSDTEVVQTIDSIDREANEQICPVASLHSAAFRLVWSDGKMAATAT